MTLFTLLLRLFQLWSLAALSVGSVSFCHTVFKAFAGIIRCSRLICYFLPSPKISNFSKKLWFLLFGNSLSDQDTGIGKLFAIRVSFFSKYHKVLQLCIFCFLCCFFMRYVFFAPFEI